MKRLMGIAGAVILLAGCATAPSTPSVRCEPVSDERAAWILGTEGGIYPVAAAAVKSLDHADAYYIAIRFSALDLRDDPPVGVWASAGGIEDGMVVSVDAMAEEFSGILKDSRFSTTDRGADEVRTCV